MSTSFKDRKPPTDAEIRDYFQILKSDPRSRVFAPLAESLIRRGRLDEAEQLCRIGLDHNQHFSDGHLVLSRVLFYRFRYEEALHEVKLTLALDPNHLEAYLIATEIFLARSQSKAASDACLKALDLDPNNPEAVRLLARVGEPLDPAAPGAPSPSPSRFKSTAGTSPSRKRADPDQAPSMTNPFQQLMQELQGEAEQLINDEDQPFTALSSGSQVDVPALNGDDDEFDIGQPTAKVARPRAAVPQLPERPPTPALGIDQVAAPSPAAPVAAARQAPEFDRSTLPPTPAPVEPSPPPGKANVQDDLLAQVPAASAPVSGPVAPNPVAPNPVAPNPVVPNPVAPQPVPSQPRQAMAQTAPATTSALRLARVDAAQAVIDSYADRIPEDPGLDKPLRVPRLSAMLPLLGMLVLLVGIVALIVYMVPAEAKKLPPDSGPAPSPVGPAPTRVSPTAAVAPKAELEGTPKAELEETPESELEGTPEPQADQAAAEAADPITKPKPAHAQVVTKKRKKPKKARRKGARQKAKKKRRQR